MLFHKKEEEETQMYGPVTLFHKKEEEEEEEEEETQMYGPVTLHSTAIIIKRKTKLV